MKGFGKVLFETWWGAPAACAVSGAGVLAGTLFGVWRAGQVAADAFGVLLLLSGLALAAAFVRSLWKRAWGRAAAQLVLGLVGAAGFVFAWVVAAVSSTWVGYALGWRAPWVGAEEKNGVVPFGVEYQRSPAMSSEFFRRVAFASGKHIGIAMDTGGYPALTVYALEDGSHALMDSAGNLFRVDAAAETVDGEVDGRWYRLPDGTEEVTGWGSGGGRGSVSVVLENGEKLTVKDGVPVGASLDGRRLLGKFVPYGKFVEGEAEDWLAEKLAPARWEGLPGWPEELPFAVERQRGKFARERWRVAFPSGKAAAMRTPMSFDFPFSLQAMADGNYSLASGREMEPPFTGMEAAYRIRPGDGCADIRVKDEWVEIPADFAEISGWGEGSVSGRDADGNEAAGTNAAPVGATPVGMRPVGLLLKNGTFARVREDAATEGAAE